MDPLSLFPAAASVVAAVFAVLAWRASSRPHATDVTTSTERNHLRQSLQDLSASLREELDRARTAQASDASAVRSELRDAAQRQNTSLVEAMHTLMGAHTAASQSLKDSQSHELTTTRAELTALLHSSQQVLVTTVDALRVSADESASRQTTAFTTAVQQLTGVVKEELAGISTRSDAMRTELADAATKTRRDLLESVTSSRTEQTTTLNALQEATQQRLGVLVTSLNEQQVAARKEVGETLATLQASNEAKLEAMRTTVQEKLDATLGERLDASFKQVSERLETVHKGLGEMQVLAQGVGSLQRTLTNVKTRGVWGELQLETLLTDLLTADQFRRQFRINPESAELADFAIKLPGRSDDSPVWLAVDSKFPMDAFEALQAAWESGDAPAVMQLTKTLLGRIDSEAASIRSKYVNPPHTTDFAVMYLPTEGLFAEVTRQPGFLHELRRKHQVVVAGPTTLTALLGSLSMGFRTLAIEKRSSEVWKVLSAVKREFENSAGTWEKLVKQLDTARNTANAAGVRHRAVERKLRSVESTPDDEVAALPVAVVDPDGVAASLLPGPRAEVTAYDELVADSTSTS